MKAYKNIILLILSLASLGIFENAQAQTPNKLIRQGNDQYKKQNYTDAEADYKKALQKSKNSSNGLFNLGNSLYQQKRYKEAYEQYAASEKLSNDKASKAQANYNMGNTYMGQKDWKSSIQAYEQALKLDPQDDQARYNLAYAKEMLKKQNKGGGENNKNNKNKNNKNNKQNKNSQNKDQKDKNKNQDKNNQDKNQQNKDNKDQQQQHPKPQPSKLSKQEAQRLLQALSQQEKKLQDKAHKGKAVPAKIDKDW